MLSELSHLQEAMDQLEKHTSDPYSLPPASEQVSSVRVSMSHCVNIDNVIFVRIRFRFSRVYFFAIFAYEREFPWVGLGVDRVKEFRRKFVR